MKKVKIGDMRLEEDLAVEYTKTLDMNDPFIGMNRRISLLNEQVRRDYKRKKEKELRTLIRDEIKIFLEGN